MHAQSFIAQTLSLLLIFGLNTNTMISKKYISPEDEDDNDSLTSSSCPCPGGRATTAVMNFSRRMRFNRIQGKSVHTRAFAHERLQSPVSYAGIDMFSRTILKTMYRTISNSTFDDESR